MEFEKKYGIPVLRLSAGIAGQYGLNMLLSDPAMRPWDHAAPVIDLDKYKDMDLSDEQKGELRFAAKTEVVPLLNPKGGIYRGFRTRMKDWATTFCLLPGDFVVVVAEWKHGAEVLTLVPPSGVPSKLDNGSMVACAMREFEEETGIVLDRVIPLIETGLPIASRGLTTRYYPFLGIPMDPLQVGTSKLDAQEQLKMFLVPLEDWVAMVLNGWTNEECSLSVTYLALTYLDKITHKF